ncbi:creatininase family protein [Roseibium alexandrii]|uniref:creatininase family protein n=1 Tax=Roseibium alexandrii TaxID=388408 RepID=UPI00374FEEE6
MAGIVKLAELTDAELRHLQPNAVGLWPIGSVEPHGHLPLGIDSMIATALLERVAEQVQVSVLLPGMPYGYLFKYKEWPGGIPVPQTAVTAMTVGLCRGLKNAGISKMFVMSGHDENHSPVLLGLQEAKREAGVRSVYCDWLDLAVTLLPRLNDSGTESHGSEIQTSVAQFLFPELNIQVPERPGDAQTQAALAMGADDFFARPECGIWVSAIDHHPGKPSASGSVTYADPGKGSKVVNHIVARASEIVEALSNEP